MSKTDLKVYCIENGLDKEVNQIMYESFILDNIDVKDKYNLGLFYDKYKNFIKKYGYETFKLCRNINNAFYHRKSRLYKRLDYMLSNGTCLFLTFTFNNNSLSSTTYEVRRRAVREYLKTYSNLYIANIDFGEKSEREHYHAVIMCSKVDFSKWKYGALNGRKMNHDKNSIECVSRYVTKLSNHALKKSTGNAHFMIYSRQFSKLGI